MKKQGLENNTEYVGKKILSTNFNTKITKIENEIPSITDLVTTDALNT